MGRNKQAPRMMQHGAYPGLSSAAGHPFPGSLPSHQLLENKFVAQEAEIAQLAGDNHRLGSAHVELREAFVSSNQDVQKLKSHIRSIQTESDIQVRVLLDKIAKMEVDIRAGDGVKKDLQEAHIEAQSLAASGQDLSFQVQQATHELKKARSEVKGIPDLQAELDGLLKEHQRLRAGFEYQKSTNIELVVEMEAKEKNLITMAREVEMLRTEILNNEKKANAPNVLGGSNPADSSGPYADAYGRVHGQMGVGQMGESMVPYRESNGVWAGPYDQR
ncbi:hypothetical protein TanjilG_26171 [Lupinus angustifolius]|uniref:Protein FLX-like 4 n=1 Tax=Lupinus angustifolius TaxID=3871 RepID=A0A4P1R2N7_LUPAN|nr:PREDICTED: protein FLX-like 4 [Lupinus angustifolius]OIV99833.1 hypothetical protein TanjilG_26171 [Lupinus angustifolius]